jgi:hypothetical protein
LYCCASYFRSHWERLFGTWSTAQPVLL